jgi:osmoprotectant transport system substrate-binding protein
MVRASHLVLAGIIACIFLSCASKPHIAVGSKNFTESVMLGEIVAQQIERRLGVEVDRTFDLGGTLLAHEALKTGSIDLYPEYTGTALTAVLKRPVNNDPQVVLAQVRQGYAQWQLSWLRPLGFNNTFAMVIRADMANQQHLTNLTEAAKRAQSWLLGVGYEFIERPDGLTGLKQTYALRLNGDPVTMDLGLLYPALRKGNIEMGAANSTDASLADPEFTLLADDRHYFPPYECALVVRDETLNKFPRLRAVLEELSGGISDATMRQLNAQVDRNHRSPADVAREFLAHIPKN